MVDVTLIVFSAVVPFVLIFFNLVVMAKYIDPQAAAGHYFAKLMILLGMLLAEGTVLLLPLDVGNRAGVLGCGFWNNSCGGLNLVLTWQIVYCIIFALIVVVFPFFIFYYEADDEGLKAQEDGADCLTRLMDFKNASNALKTAVPYTLVTMVIAAIILGVSYIYLSYTYIPYRLTTIDVASTAFKPLGTPIALSTSTTVCATSLCPCGTGSCNWTLSSLRIQVTFILYMAALMSFVGWFFFAMYVGIGFVALPMDLFNAWRYRPRLLTAAEAKTKRRQLKDRAEELMKVGEAMASRVVEFNDEMHDKKTRRKQGKVDQQEMNRYRVLIDVLERDYDEFKLCDPQEYRKHYNPLVPWAKLVGSVISVILTVLWMVHIMIYMLFSPPVHPLLNAMLTWFDTWFPLFGTLSVALFGMYLLLAVAKGNFKFGTRFFLIKVHPMEVNKTLMNAFVFNIGLILLCTLPVTQFLTQAFSQYARLTDADLIFGQQFRFLEFFRFFWQYNAFLFCILIFTFLSLIYFSLCPSDREHWRRIQRDIMEKNKVARAKTQKDLEKAGGSLVEMQNRKKERGGK